MEHARFLSDLLVSQAASINGRIVVLTGARQVGKTTLVKTAENDYTYLSVEDPIVGSQLTKLTSAQWKNLYPKATLDEVQREPLLVRSIKAAYDQYDDVRYLLLGSSQILLLEKVRESLAGRCIIMEMYPLTLPELQATEGKRLSKSLWMNVLSDKSFDVDMLYPSFTLVPNMVEIDKAWQHYLTFGGYPALVNENLSDHQRYEWLNNYVRTYLERDIRDLAQLRDLEPYRKLQVALAAQTGCLLNSSKLATEIGVSSKTVKNYVNYLNISYQVLVLPSWERNLEKRLVKSPKVHYLDGGVLQAVLQKRGGITGREFESLVVAELYKQATCMMSDARFYHYRTLDGAEVDLLVETPSGYYAFEIKMNSKVLPSDARQLNNIGPVLDKPLLHSFILTNDTETKHFSSTVTAINVEYFLG